METVTFKEFGLHIELTIDTNGKHWFVADMLSGKETPIYETPDGWNNADLVAYVGEMLDVFQSGIEPDPGAQA